MFQKTREYWLVTVPTREGSLPRHETLNQLHNKIGKYSQIFEFEIPDLKVGTLGILMGLSDDLEKIDHSVDNLIKRIERQYHDVQGEDVLDIDGRPIERVLERFSWDEAKYQYRKPLTALVGDIQSNIGRIEEDLKRYTTRYSELSKQLALLRRKKSSNISQVPLEDMISPDLLYEIDIMNSEHLVTLIAMVPKNFEDEFLNTYESMCNDLAGYGGPDWVRNDSNLGEDDGNFGKEADRDDVKGSPVVPGSAQKITTYNDYFIYKITILRGQYEAGYIEEGEFRPGQFIDFIEPMKHKAKEYKFFLRDFDYDMEKVGLSEEELELVEEDTRHLEAEIVHWSRTHYGEAYMGLLHLKVIRSFVEAVLHYGLPAQFLTILLLPKKNRFTEITNVLRNMYKNLGEALFIDEHNKELEDEEEDEPYVCHKFHIQIEN